MICATPSPPVAYLWEPFSLEHRPGICDADFRLWFRYVCSENADAYRGAIADMLDFKYRTGAEFRVARTPKDAARLVRDRARFARYRRQDAVPLMKDPIAVFSAEWLSDTFGADTLVIIRHPAAFVNSIKRRALRHPFGHFVAQPLLMQDLLQPFADQIDKFAAEEQPLLDQGILLWNVIHHAILEFRARRPDWIFVRLEDLAGDPVAEFEKIHARLGLTLTEDVKTAIIHSSSAPDSDSLARRDDVSRDSRASTVAWKKWLTGQEIDRIRENVDPIAREFYADEDW